MYLEGAVLIGTRVVAILIGAVIAAAMAFGFGARWYVSLPAAVAVYLIMRYAGWLYGEQQRAQAFLDEHRRTD